MTWAAQNIQLVWFIPSATAPDAQQFWEALFDSRPDNFNRTSNGPFSQSQASGALGDGLLTIMVQPGRIDLVYTAVAEPGQVSGLIGDIPSAVNRLIEVLPGAVKFPCNRLALVVSAARQVATPEAGRAEMAELLPNVQFPAGSTDQVVQFNVRAQIAGVAVNRVCRWGVGVQQLVNMALAIGGEGHGVFEERVLLLWQLDINSVQAAEPYSSDLVPDLAKGLAEEALALLSEGYLRLLQNA